MTVLLDSKFDLSRFAVSRRIRIALISALISIALLITVLESQEIEGYSVLRHLRKPPSFPSADLDAFEAPTQEGANPGRYAYATWLSSTVSDIKGGMDMKDDAYFIATRILVWQLLHDKDTRTNSSIPVLVMCTPDVSQDRVDRLAKDGAQIVQVEFVKNGASWLKPGRDRWVSIMSKLRLWEFTQYSRILYMDGDMMLKRSLDGVFEDPAAQTFNTLDNVTETTGKITVPENYIFAGIGEVENEKHKYPPDWSDFKNQGRFNGGFFLLGPSRQMFEYYMSILDTPNSFDSTYMEQTLLNHAHSLNGSMPWKELSSTWNIRAPTMNDLKKGVASVHDKWWKTPKYDPKIAEWFKTIRWRMEGFYEAYDAALEAGAK
ncbi:MAG: hypothetical protein M4579_001098 [Chaenotheca gracillima]|nr:MAG: hypothetical protein M4579_001098 [Chaenotheca gracillima]